MINVIIKYRVVENMIEIGHCICPNKIVKTLYGDSPEVFLYSMYCENCNNLIYEGVITNNSRFRYCRNRKALTKFLLEEHDMIEEYHKPPQDYSSENIEEFRKQLKDHKYAKSK